MNTALKIGKLPDTTPVKLTIALHPELQDELQTYVQIYEHTYGEKASLASLIPFMLRAFLASDNGFKKAKRQIDLST